MTNWHIVMFLFLGWLIGWSLKYIIFGLGNWDKVLHPERFTADTTGPYKIFAQPFLGAFSS
jgi:protein-S-isoprenylcysteine O-methyltransferase Ste14